MKEIVMEPQQLQLIRTERTSLIPVQQKNDKPITGREYRQMLRKAWFAFGVSMGVNIVLAIAVYILQAGPV